MKKIAIFLLAIFIILIILVLGTAIMRADDTSTQGFTMNNRYALLSGRILVDSKYSDNQTIADAILKIDAVTGDVWILQMTINSPQTPNIVSAEFVPTTYFINNEYSE